MPKAPPQKSFDKTVPTHHFKRQFKQLGTSNPISPSKSSETTSTLKPGKPLPAWVLSITRKPTH